MQTENEIMKDYAIKFAVATPVIIGALIWLIANDKERAKKQMIAQLIPSMLVGGVIGSWYGNNKFAETKNK
jgi:uncharacterized membrane protein YsdA (DUF1294 family)